MMLFSDKYKGYIILVFILFMTFFIFSKIHDNLMKSEYRGSGECGENDTFLLGVTVKFRSIGDKDNFKTLFKGMADYVENNEPMTISYKLYESDSLPLQGYIFERYTDKSAFIDIHRKSSHFIAFREALKKLEESNAVTLEGHSYIPSSIGFG